MRIRHILCVVVRRLLPRGVRGIAHNHRDRCLPLHIHPVRVPREKLGCNMLPLLKLPQLERIRQTDPRKTLIRRPLSPKPVIHILDIHRRNIVRKKNDLICMNLRLILPLQILRANQTACKKPRNKRPRPRKRIQNMYTLIRQTTPELPSQNLIHRPQHKIHNLNRRVHNPQLLHHLRKRRLKERLIQPHNNPLPPLRIINPCNPFAHTLIIL